jgi:hypothetical protein
MPQRFLRPGITSSRRFNACSWFAQSLYIRLLTLVDDFGRFDADIIVLRGLAFPLGDEKSEPVPVDHVMAARSELEARKLLTVWKAGEKEFLQVTNWQERARASASKYPEPPDSCKQMLSNVVSRQQILPPSSSPSSSPAPSSTPSEGVFECLRAKLNYVYKRGTRHWTDYEEHALLEIARQPTATAELDELLRWRDSLHGTDKKYFPQSLPKLLENWTGCLDRARLNRNGDFHTPTAAESEVDAELADISRGMRDLMPKTKLPERTISIQSL